MISAQDRTIQILIKINKVKKEMKDIQNFFEFDLLINL